MMRCETCQGRGWHIDDYRQQRIPCPPCGGSGISHCCDGLQTAWGTDSRGELVEYTNNAAWVQEQRDPGDEASTPSAKEFNRAYLRAWFDTLDQKEQRDPGDEMPNLKLPAFHENPIIDALLTEAADAALDTMVDAIIGEPTGCADDCCHPSHNHGAPRARYVAVVRDFVILQGEDAKHGVVNSKWWRAIGDPIAWPTPDESDTHDEWRKLNDE